MNIETIKIIKKDLLSQSKENDLIELVVREKETQDSLMPDVTARDDPEQKTRKITIAALYALYQNDFDHLETIKRQYSPSSEELILWAETVVDLAHINKEPARAFKIIEYMELDPGRLKKTIVSYLSVLLHAEEFEAASEIRRNYKELCKNDQRVNDILQDTFKRNMVFRAEVSKRDYSKALKFQKLFQLPKEITYPIVIEEIDQNNKTGNYLAAATLSQMFGLNPSVTNKAAFRVWKSEMRQFQNNLDQGLYQTIDQSDQNDPYVQAKNISEQFHLFDYKNIYGNLSRDIIRLMQEIALPISEKTIDPNSYPKNSPYAKILLSHCLINDYQLTNSDLAVGIADKTTTNIVKLIAFIQEESKDIKSAKNYKPIIDDLLKKAPIEDDVIDNISMKLLFIALDAKDFEYGKKIFDTYVIDIKEVAPQLSVYANDMANSDHFNLLLDFVEIFDLQKMLKDNEMFMGKINAHYDEYMKEKKYLNCFAIADLFRMANKKRVYPITLLIDEHLKSQSLDEIHKIMKKYKIKKRDVKGSAKLMYLNSIKTDRDYAIKLRKDFDLSYFDVGLITWFLYELLKLNTK